LKMQQAMAPLHNICHYMNMKMDVPTRMSHSRGLLEEGRRQLQAAHEQVHEQGQPFASHAGPKTWCKNCKNSGFDDLGKPCLSCSAGTSAHSENRWLAYETDLLDIHCANVNFAYPEFSGGGAWILDSCSFSIPQGRLVMVTGPRSGGKGTLLQLLASVLTSSDRDCHPSLVHVPPHLRVLHVGNHPIIMPDLSLFDNLCFGPSDGPDEDPQRIFQLCRRLGVSEDIMQLIEDEAPTVPKKTNSRRSEGAAPALNGIGSCTNSMCGTPSSCISRRHFTSPINEGSVMAHSDKCLLHLARALVMNPDVLVMHKPLEHFDDQQAWHVLGILREFVDYRGLELSPDSSGSPNLPRTCIFSASTTRFSEVSDLILHVGNGKVQEVSQSALSLLREYSRELFSSLDYDGDGKVQREEFSKAINLAPWAATIVGVPEEWIDAKCEDKIAEQLGKIFDEIDRNLSGEIDLDELVAFFHRKADSNLPRMMRALAAKQCQSNVEEFEADPMKWRIPKVAREASNSLKLRCSVACLP